MLIFKRKQVLRPAISIIINPRLLSSLHGLQSPNIIEKDTIYALSSGPGRAAIAVLRISGPHADTALHRLLPVDHNLPPPRVASLIKLQHPVDNLHLDTALCLRFPAPRSATGEDVIEIHAHGGIAVVKALTDALSLLPGLRPAKPGEFTRRAFDNKRMDLTEVEGTADLLSADTESQRIQALASFSGTIRKQCHTWRSMLVTSLANIEAVIDFGEDDDIADDVAHEILPQVRRLRMELEEHMHLSKNGELIRDGVRVALCGAPNVGKSSLLNALSGRDVAIVSPVAGTTRDVLEVALDLGGYKVLVSDCAGVRETDDPIEKEGVRRARKSIEDAHIILAMKEACTIRNTHTRSAHDNNNNNEWPLVSMKDRLDNSHTRVLQVINKADLLPNEDIERKKDFGNSSEEECMYISCVTGQGVDQLTDKLKKTVEMIMSDATMTADSVDRGGTTVLLNRARHRHHVQECIDALLRYESIPKSCLELAAEELRVATSALGKVTGEVDIEEVLESIFSQFCIGK